MDSPTECCDHVETCFEQAGLRLRLIREIPQSSYTTSHIIREDFLLDSESFILLSCGVVFVSHVESLGFGFKYFRLKKYSIFFFLSYLRLFKFSIVDLSNKTHWWGLLITGKQLKSLV